MSEILALKPCACMRCSVNGEEERSEDKREGQLHSTGEVFSECLPEPEIISCGRD